MTGGQDAVGMRTVPDLTRKLEAEGVRRTIVCTDEPHRYRGVEVAGNAEVWHRDRLDEAQRVLRELPGVTALVYDQQCAAQARRLRKRGKLAPRTMRVVINEDVCEGCGDCGRKSNCLSVQPVETDLGRKRRIDQTSCNTDYSCLDGDCPSFVTVEAGPPMQARRPPAAPASPEPQLPQLDSTYNVFLAGVGGTGVVTVNQVLATAAVLDGLEVHTLDQTGMSQKAGPVVSHLRVAHDAIEPANRVGPGQADCYLALDLLTGSDSRSLACAHAGRTRAFVSGTEVPTGSMVSGSGSSAFPSHNRLLGRIRSSTRDVVEMDTFAAANTLFGHTTPAHFLLIGAAYQAGALPLSAAAIERAIELNGVGADDNVAAFRWGRAALAEPAAYAAATTRPGRGRRQVHPLPDSPLAGATREAAEVRAAQLAAYGGERLVRRYLDVVEAAWRAEREVTGGTDFSRAVAVGLHRVLAVKDEYEVARLLTAPEFAAWIDEQVPGARGLRYRLHPPLLRALGLRHKLALGPAWRPLLVLLARLRFLRGTPFDPFGYAHVRRVERALAREYETLVTQLTLALDADGYAYAVEAAGAIELVCGYEAIKLASIDRYRARLGELGVAAPA
jgi:indolepyruvate ferredoxin oxidoreductase